MQRAKPRPEDGVAVLLLLLFAGLSLVFLDRFPHPHEDEAWIAAPGYGLFTTGRFATPLFAGLFGSELRFYGFMPLVSILTGGAAALLGRDLFSIRLVSVALATVTLGLTYLAGRRFLGPRRALLAIGLLLSWPLLAPAPFLATGIPLVDLARIARYDIGVPVFGLAALLAAAGGGAGAAGLLAGLATLCHAYGAVWLLVAVALALTAGPRRGRPAAACLGSFGVALVPWLLFVARDPAAFVAQNRWAADRVDLLSWRFYAASLLEEPRRWSLLAANARSGSPAPWLFAGAVALGLVAHRRDARFRPVALALGLHLVLYALLLRPKPVWYLATVWPLLALTAAAGLAAVWRRGARAIRIALVSAFAVASIGGAVRIATLARDASRSPRHRDLSDRVTALLPPGSRVLALPPWWLGLGAGAEVRSIAVPASLANPTFTRAPTTFESAAEAIPADVVLVDPPLRAALEVPAGQPYADLAREMSRYLTGRFRLAATLDDPSYGRIEVWRRARPTP